MLTGILHLVYFHFALNVQRVHLSTEESPASWMVKLFGEVGGGVPEYFSFGEVFSINDVVNSYREKTVLKTLQLVFSCKQKKNKKKKTQQQCSSYSL